VSTVLSRARSSLFALTLALTSGACSSPEATQNVPNPCGGVAKPHAPGELIGGQDPATLLAPYWGDYPGTLSWTNGGETPFTLSLEPGTDTNVYAPVCDNPRTFYVYSNLGLTTGDGGLKETDTSIFEVPLTAVDFAPGAGALGPSDISDWQWQGDVTPHLPSNNASYTDRGLLPDVDWPLGTARPTALRLYFYAMASGARDNDRILIASVTFP
jgi:hypothetical protein